MTTNSEKKRINILDLIVILVVLAIVALGAYMLFGDSAGKAQTVSSNVRFTIEATRMEPDFVNYLKEGQTIYDGATKNELGKIVAIHEKPARMLVENHDAMTVDFAEVPDKVDVTLEVEAKAKMEYPNIIVDTVSLKIGKQVHCTVDEAVIHGTIIGLDYDASLLTKKEETK